jgi:hypothetical protein
MSGFKSKQQKLNEKQQAVDFIRSLNEQQLVDFFYEALADRRVQNTYDDGFEIETWCLVQSQFGSYQNKPDDAAIHEFTALPIEALRDDKELQSIKVITQQGRCEQCQTDVLSVCKRASCPVCEALVECT